MPLRPPPIIPSVFPDEFEPAPWMPSYEKETYNLDILDPTISTCNDTLDNFLGGGFLHHTFNVFERQGPSSKVLESVINKTFASASIYQRHNLLVINFNSSVNINSDTILNTLPAVNSIQSDYLYKNLSKRWVEGSLKCAWRYSRQAEDMRGLCNMVDFSLKFIEDKKQKNSRPEKNIKVINALKTEKMDLNYLLNSIEQVLQTFPRYSEGSARKGDVREKAKAVNIMIVDALHPASYFCDEPLIEFFYFLRCISRRKDLGAILMCYDKNMIGDHDRIKQKLYNLADSVVSFYTYESDESRDSAHTYADGILEYVKIPKMNTYGIYTPKELSDWGYRFHGHHRYFVIDELNLQPHKDQTGPLEINARQAADLADPPTKHLANSNDVPHYPKLRQIRPITVEFVDKSVIEASIINK